MNTWVLILLAICLGKDSLRLSVFIRVALAMVLSTVCSIHAADRELIRDPQFHNGFTLLEPQPGNRVPYGELAGNSKGGSPVWDLAQWSSRFPLRATDRLPVTTAAVYSNAAKLVVIGSLSTTNGDLALRVNAEAEYPRARKSSAEPWVHLLVQQDFSFPPSLGEMERCNFRVEARLKHSRLVSTNDYSPSIHAAQFLIYMTIANQNPKAKGFQECFWFGIPVYDNRARVVPAYEAQDFGDTKLFIFTPSSDTFADGSLHDGQWVTFEKDLMPLFRRGLEHARARGFIRGSSELNDYRLLGVFIGWEVPGRFDVEVELRNLSLKAAPLRPGSPSPKEERGSNDRMLGR